MNTSRAVRGVVAMTLLTASAAAAVVLLAPAAAQASSPPTRDGIVAIAQRELNDSTRNYEYGGTTNCTYYSGVETGWPTCGHTTDGVAWRGGTSNGDSTYAWCANFAKYVWTQAGVTSYVSELGTYAQSFEDYGQAHATWHTRTSGYLPQPGDAVVYDWADSHGNRDGNIDHVGVVTSVSGSTLYTIAGNTGDDDVAVQTHAGYASDADIVGFTSPVGLVTTNLVNKSGSLVDINGDGRNDIMAIDATGNLHAYVHAPSNTIQVGTWQPAVTVGAGWSIYNWVGFADLNGDGRPDILARDADGNLYAYQHVASNTVQVGMWSPAVLVGAGWNVYNEILLGDVDDSGKTDIIARKPDGTIWGYSHVASSTIQVGMWSAGVQITSGMASYTQMVLANVSKDNSRTTGDGPELIAEDTSGNLWAMPNGDTGSMNPFGNRVQIGAGWNVYSTILTGDVNGDGYADLTARDTSGGLWTYPNKQIATTGVNWNPRIQVGAGWDTFVLID
jgi:hypothetical protein